MPVGRKTIKRGKKSFTGKDFRLSEEIDYIRGRAAEYDGRLVTMRPLALFSTETGDATTRSTAMPSSTSTTTPPVSPPSLATPPAASLCWSDRKFQNIFG